MIDLERMRRFGAYEERERIIKLLEEHYGESTLLPSSVALTAYLNAITASIALIKEENK